jgi:hypothetical protein
MKASRSERTEDEVTKGDSIILMSFFMVRYFEVHQTGKTASLLLHASGLSEMN